MIAPTDFVAKALLYAIDHQLGRRFTLIEVRDQAAPDWSLITAGIRVLPHGRDADLPLLSVDLWEESAHALADQLTAKLRSVDPSHCLTTSLPPLLGRSSKVKVMWPARGVCVYVDYEDGWLFAEMLVGGQQHSDTGHFYPVADHAFDSRQSAAS